MLSSLTASLVPPGVIVNTLVLFSLMSTSPAASGIVCTLFHWVIDWINVEKKDQFKVVKG
ncbi:unnamed protein product [Musa acuminata subsp. burmannicoides]